MGYFKLSAVLFFLRMLFSVTFSWSKGDCTWKTWSFPALAIFYLASQASIQITALVLLSCQQEQGWTMKPKEKLYSSILEAGHTWTILKWLSKYSFIVT